MGRYTRPFPEPSNERTIMASWNDPRRPRDPAEPWVYAIYAIWIIAAIVIILIYAGH